MNEVATQGFDTPRPVPAPAAVSPQAAASDRPRLAATVETGGRGLPQENARTARSTGDSRKADPAAVDSAVVELNSYLQSLEREVRISVDADAGRPVIQVVDGETQEVIRQIPDELVIRLAQNLKDDQEVNLLDARI